MLVFFSISSVTLGDFHISSKDYLRRREPADLFERDPFKIHSYNFRYASKPLLSVPPWLLKANNVNNMNNDCQTFFYNYDYPNTNVSIQTSSPLENDERLLSLAKFQTYRRKKFLQESVPARLQDMTNRLPTTSNSNESKILNIDKGCQSSKSSPIALLKKPIYIPSYVYKDLPNNISTIQDVQPYKTQTPPSMLYQNRSISVQDTDVKRRHSLGSSCDININIKNLENNSSPEGVNIKIATDSLCRNLNSASINPCNNFNRKSDSSNTFVIDKELSKFRLKKPESQEVYRRKDADRIKDLTAIYSSQVLKKPKRYANSYERLPSLIPVNNSVTMRNNNNCNIIKNSFTRSKSMIEKSKNDISISTLKNSPYDILTSSTKRLQNLSPSTLNSSRRSLPGSLNKSPYKSTTIPLKIGNVPINVNINLYTDSLNSLKF